MPVISCVPPAVPFVVQSPPSGRRLLMPLNSTWPPKTVRSAGQAQSCHRPPRRWGQLQRARGGAVGRPQSGSGCALQAAEQDLAVEDRQVESEGARPKSVDERLRWSTQRFRWPCRSSPKDHWVQCVLAAEKNDVWQHRGSLILDDRRCRSSCAIAEGRRPLISGGPTYVSASETTRLEARLAQPFFAYVFC